MTPQLKKRYIKHIALHYGIFGQASAFNLVNDINRTNRNDIIPFETCKGCDTASPSIDHVCLICGQETKTIYTVRDNQYIPRNGRSLASGMPACATYYYVTNSKNQTIGTESLKPYRGKDLGKYWMHSKEQAENFVKKLLTIR